MKNKSTTILSLISIIGPIFYFSLLTVLGFMWKDYNPISTSMSEIGAVDSPFKDVMNYFGFSLLGLSIMLFSFEFKHHFNKISQSTIVFILLILGGIGMFLVGFFPCDPGCIDVTRTGRLHSISSTIPALLIPFAVILSAKPISRKWSKNWGYLSFCLGILSMSAGPLIFVKSIENFSGLIQRLGIGFSLSWIVLVSFKILRKYQ